MSSSLLQCRDCARLVAHREQVQQRYPDYHCRPVPASGDPRAPLLIVGLAPGLHGANRTGVPFTGDASGEFLFAHLVRRGWARASGDGVRLSKARITNVVKCLPPQNRPVAAEVNNCRRFLLDELAALPDGGCVLLLGRIAHDAVIRSQGLRLAEYPFQHGAAHLTERGQLMVDSYHPSRYNINTGRLDDAMFEQALDRIGSRLS